MRPLAAIILFLASLLPAAAQEVIGASEAHRAALAGDMLLVDIRTPGEWAETGVPDVAHPINLREEGFFVLLKALMDANPGKPLAVICATGGRSTFLATALAQRGMAVLNVQEGMFGSAAGPGWLKRSLPVRAPDTPPVE